MSPKVDLQVVDVFKKGELARALNVSHEGTAVIEIGAKHEEAKTFDEEGVTGAVIRILKGGERTVCVLSGSGEHRLEESGADGLSGFQTLVQKDNYKTKTISLLEKAEIPADCTTLVIAGPTGDYIPSALDAIKKYVEDAGRLLLGADT